MLHVTVGVWVRGMDGSTLLEVTESDTVLQVGDGSLADEAALLRARLGTMMSALTARTETRAGELAQSLGHTDEA